VVRAIRQVHVRLAVEEIVVVLGADARLQINGATLDGAVSREDVVVEGQIAVLLVERAAVAAGAVAGEGIVEQGHVAAGGSNRAAVPLAAVAGEDAVNHRERVAVVYETTAGVVQNPGPGDGQRAAAGDADPVAVPDEEAAQRDRHAAA